MNPSSLATVERETGRHPTSDTRLAGGCIADVYRIEFDTDFPIVAKESASGGLSTEAWMLEHLAARSELPVPDVVFGDDNLLLMTYIENDGGPITAGVQEHAADLLAQLHSVRVDGYGLERDTLIGSLHQPNPLSSSWVDFFREHRLYATAGVAHARGGLSDSALARIQRLCERLDEWIDEPEAASLIHGDMWGGNVLVLDGRIAGFVDPAIYHADADIELAFSTLFGTFGDAFFSRYQEHRPLRPGFFEVRRDIYNVYPLLVHAALFGGHYGASAEATARRLVG